MPSCPGCGYAANVAGAATCNLCGALLVPTRREARAAQTPPPAAPALAPAVAAPPLAAPAPTAAGDGARPAAPPAATARHASPADLIVERRAADAARDLRIAQKRRRRLLTHAVIGAVLFFVVNQLLSLPMAWHPLVILGNLVGGVLFGLPLGWLISASGGGMYRGALFGWLLCALLSWLSGLLVGGHGSLVAALFASLVPGALTGALMGTHVDLDR